MKPLPQLSDYPIPETIELECKVLSTMINDSTTIPQVMRVIKPEMFSLSENRKVWDTLMDMYNKREAISLVTVMPKVERKHYVDNILTAETAWGIMGLEGLMGAFVDTYIKRCAYIKSVEVLQKINSGMNCEAISDMFEGFKNDVMTGFRDDTAKSSTDIANELAEKLMRGETNRVPTAIHSVDYYTYGGLGGGNLVILAARPSVGKAQPIHTKVLTPNGYREIGSLAVGDKVMGRDGKEQEVLGVFPQGTRPVYKVTMNDGASVLCDEEHIWTITDVTLKRKKEQELTLKEMMRRGLKASLTPSRAKSHRKPVSKYRIPKVMPIEFSEKEYPIHPYLLGLLIGDGCLTGNAATISNPESDYELIERASKLLPSGYHFVKNDKPVCPYYIIAQDKFGVKNGFIRIVKNLGLNVYSRDKFIPSEYLLGSVQQRLDLLRGLMDTDGSVGKDGYASFSTTSKTLADNVVELVRSLGGMSYIHSYDRTNDGKAVEYDVVVSMNICPFYLERKEQRWHPTNRSRFIEKAERVDDMECVCIYVSNQDHCYVTENYIVTHNTTIGLQMALNASRIGKKTMIFSLEMSAEELVQRLILSTGYITPTEFFTKNFDWNNYERAINEVTNKNLIINEKSNGIDEICQKIRVECQTGDCKFVMIDYLGLIPITNTRLNTAVALGEITRKLKLTAKECNIPILLLCQLNRQSASENRSPQLYDLRDSGAIEQDADMVIMLEKAKDDMGGILENTIDLWIRKNRNGKCNFDNAIRLIGNETYSQFTEQ